MDTQKPAAQIDHLIGKPVTVHDRTRTFTGTLRWATNIDVPGLIEVVNPNGKVEVGGMHWTFDSIEERDHT